MLLLASFEAQATARRFGQRGQRGDPRAEVGHEAAARAGRARHAHGACERPRGRNREQ